MKLSDFDYQLPKELIAQYPLTERQQARLLVVDRKKKSLTHRVFYELPEYLKRGDLLVLNDTKVLTCRLEGRRRTGGKVEALLLAHKDGLTFRALLRPARLKIGETIHFNQGGLSGTLSGRNEITFSARNCQEVYAHGQIPLPPYIRRQPEEIDQHYYQTVYAASAGAVASPTAGLHFTPALLDELRDKGVEVASLTLHVGYATFRPVSCEDIRQHQMEYEQFRIDEPLLQSLARTRKEGGKVVAVGTTAMRALETYAGTGVAQGKTNLFIYPGYRFKLVDCLVTNFHLPRTTLFMLVCAFTGTELAHQAYAQAVAQHYRFYSYGDAMLIG